MFGNIANVICWEDILFYRLVCHLLDEQVKHFKLFPTLIQYHFFYLPRYFKIPLMFAGLET